MVHRKLSYKPIDTPHIIQHSWRLGLFNMSGFEGTMCGRGDRTCQACNKTHPVDIYGALVWCEKLSHWRTLILRTFPTDWQSTIQEYTGWEDQSTQSNPPPTNQSTQPNTNILPFSDQRNLLRHLMPLSLHQILLSNNLLSAATVRQWHSSLGDLVGVVKNIPQDLSFPSIVPCPQFIKTPEEAEQNRTRKRNRAVFQGFPTASNPSNNHNNT